MSTLTDTAGEVPTPPSMSVAEAVSECVPVLAVWVSHEVRYGGAVTVPISELSTKNDTLFMVSLLAAVAEIVTTALTVEPALGLVI